MRLLLSAALAATALSSCAPSPPADCGPIPVYTGAPTRDGPDLAALQPLVTTPIGPEDDAPLRAGFQHALDETGTPSATVAIARGGVIWSSSTGTRPGALHYWGSVGKTFTALTVMRLAEDGLLDVDDPVSDYTSGVPQADDITLRMLLAHTSGLPRDGESASVLIDCPGRNWRYSNLGYKVLGEVIETVSGQTYADAVRTHVIDRTTARNIRVLLPGEVPADVMAARPEPGENIVPLARAQAAGGVVADAESMVRVWDAMVSGQIVSDETLSQMLETLYPMFQGDLFYGLGLMTYDVVQPDGSIQLWVGHSGGIPGAKAAVAYAPEAGAVVAAALIGNGPAEATGNALVHGLTQPR